MIDWTDPDYVSAGQFYALVKSVSIKCADDQQQSSASSTVTSYTYGGNASSGSSPAVGLSNSSTLVNSAEGMMGGFTDSRIKVALGVVIGVIMLSNVF
jgi:hypothetical protein